MINLPEKVISFLEGQGFVIVSTLEADQTPHNSCKGIVKIDRKGKVYLLDLYKGRTYDNLKRNPKMSIAAVDEHKFKGYCLKGEAEIIPTQRLGPALLKNWEDRITSRLTQRVVRNIREEKGHSRHPESLLPKPEYMIVMEVRAIVDLTPHHIREGV